MTKDMIGNHVRSGDYVAYASTRHADGLVIYKILDASDPKKVSARAVETRWSQWSPLSGKLVYLTWITTNSVVLKDYVPKKSHTR